MTTTFQQTYEYCEYLINEEINSLVDTAYLNTEGEALVRFKQELKDLYAHLLNIERLIEGPFPGQPDLPFSFGPLTPQQTIPCKVGDVPYPFTIDYSQSPKTNDQEIWD